ncbi:MAG: lamin tail domain-containing protein [Candidatus Competibacterales bacterium]
MNTLVNGPLDPLNPATGGNLDPNPDAHGVDADRFANRSAEGAPQEAGKAPLRIMAGNITSGRNQSYDEGHGARIFQGLAPDVALIQEFNYGNNSKAAIDEFVADTFGEQFNYYREPGAQIPNGIISRFPIKDAGTWDDPQVDNREFAWARIDIPGEKDLWAVSVHFLTRNASTRDAEAKELVNQVRNFVPPEDYLVIGGDFNTSKMSEPAYGTLDEVIDLDHQPADADGRIGTNAKRAKPYDGVWADGDLNAHHVPVAVGDQQFDNGLVFDSRVFDDLDAVAPVRKGDSGAEAMQHMAVVKDFMIPTDGEAVPNRPTFPVDGVDAVDGVDGVDGVGGANALRIAAALPNPAGGDAGNEQMTLQNTGDAPIDLEGWRLLDKSGAWVELTGEVAPGADFTLTLEEGKLPLGNGGDTLRLINPLGDTVHEVSYTRSEAGSGDRVEF